MGIVGERLAISGLVLLTALGLCQTPSSGQTMPQRVSVYLDTHNPLNVDVVLTLADVILHGAGGSATIELDRDLLDARQDGGRQFHLGFGLLPGGSCDSLTIRFAGIDGALGAARLHPAPPPEGVALAVDAGDFDDPSRALFLRWLPRAVAEDRPVHQPEFQLVGGSVPPLGSVAFVTAGEAGLVLAVDPAAGRVAAAEYAGAAPCDIAHSVVTSALFVALADDDAVAILDPTTLRRLRTVALQFGDRPERLLVATREPLLYVLCPGSRVLVALSLNSLQVEFRLPLDDEPTAFVEDRDTGRLYVAGRSAGRIQIIDPELKAAVGGIPCATAPGGLAIDATAKHLLVGSGFQGRIGALDLESGSPVGQLNICGPTRSLVVDPRAGWIYVSMPMCEEIAVVQPARGLEFSPLRLPGRPGLMVFDAGFRRLLVTLPEKGAVAVCDPSHRQVTRVVATGGRPWSVVAP